VWDGRPEQQEFVYRMRAGDVIFLDNGVWHQAKPITSGTRWALVLFLRVR
jgi:quercetin dioxygenase-like cupin family protein